jgi:hypothetical protein
MVGERALLDPCSRLYEGRRPVTARLHVPRKAAPRQRCGAQIWDGESAHLVPAAKRGVAEVPALLTYLSDHDHERSGLGRRRERRFPRARVSLILSFRLVAYVGIFPAHDPNPLERPHGSKSPTARVDVSALNTLKDSRSRTLTPVACRLGKNDCLTTLCSPRCPGPLAARVRWLTR